MKKLSIQSIVLTLTITVFASIGGSLPAQAASIPSATATSSTSLYFSQTNSSTIVVDFSLPTAVAANAMDYLAVNFMSGSWAATVSQGDSCGAIASVASSMTVGTCELRAMGSKGIRISQPSGFDANSTWTFTFQPNTLRMPSSGSLMLMVESGGASGVVDQNGSLAISLSAAPAGSTVTFNGNGNTGGSMSNQIASSSTALTSNGFSKSGYTFAGWATTQTGAVAYADGANYPFAASATLYAQWIMNSAGATSTLTMDASIGDFVAGSTVSIVANGLQSTAAYTVVVQSTPQTLGIGNATSGSVNTSVTLPSGLEAGWHTLTFSSTAADGSAVSNVLYFKLSVSGALLSSSTTVPAELAVTGFNVSDYLFGGNAIVMLGVALMLIARRKRKA